MMLSTLGNCIHSILSSRTPNTQLLPPQVLCLNLLLGVEKVKKLYIQWYRAKCNQETPSRSGFIFQTKNHRGLVAEKAHWPLFLLLHFHVLCVLKGTLQETWWHQRDSQTDKGSEHSSTVSGPLLALRHLFIVPSVSSNKTSRNLS